MDDRNRTTDRGGRTLLTLALLLLAGTTGAAFGRIFAGLAPTARLVIAAGLAVLIGALFHRRHLALSVAASGVVLLVLLGVLVFPRTTWYFLPTGATVDSLLRALGNLGQRAVEETTPAPALPALFSASLIAVWSAAYAAHALAVRAASPILALVPPAALLGFANVVAEDGARPAYVAVFLLAALGVAFSAGIFQLGAWGPILPRRSAAALHITAGPTGRLARRLAVAVTAVAVLLPGLLPGFGAAAMLDIDGGGERVAISPLVDIRPNLLRTPALELFTVESDRGAYWRLQSLDEYTGRFWRSSDPQAAHGTAIGSQAALPNPATSRVGRILSQRFELDRLGGDRLPAAFMPVGVSAPGADLRHDPNRTVLLSPGGIPENLEYTVTSNVLVPTVGELDRQFDFSVADPRYTALPDDTPDEIFAVADEMTRGTSTPFRAALAIQNYLRNFTYDVNVATEHDYDDIIEFLRLQRGYCQQFAATMAVLLRALGYPARVAVGFLNGQQDEAGVFHVTTQEAHAWVEMYFPGFGWLPFEPTPGRQNPNATSLSPDPSIPEFPGSGQGEVATVGSAGPQGVNPQRDHIERRFGGGGIPPLEALEPESQGPARPAWFFTLLGAAALAVLLLIAVPTVKWGRRRLLVRRARSPRELVLATYDVFDDRAEDLGLHRRLEETPFEYRDRLRGTVPFSDGDMDRLTALVGMAAYAPEELDGRAAQEAARAARNAGRDLRRHVGRGRALLGSLRPFPRD